MSTEVSIYDKFEHPSQLQEFGKAIMHSEMFGAKSASQGMVLAMECAARRLPPMMLAERYHIIHGKLSMKADAILADFRTKCGGSHKILKRDGDEACVELILNGHGQTFSLTWTDAMNEPFVYEGKESVVVAKLVKGETRSLTVKAKYRTPRSRTQMLWARVVSDAVRAMAPEVLAGHYTPEEISDFDDHEDVVIDVETTPVEAEVPSAGIHLAEPPTEPATPAAVAIPDAPVPERVAEKKPGVRLDGKSDPYEVNDSDPCGEEMATQIKTLARSLEMPPEKLKAIMADEGVAKLANLSYRRAAKILEKLKQRASDKDIPF